MNGPNWLNDPAIADELRDRGHHYDLWELAEANGRLSEMGSFGNYEAESRFVRPEDLIEFGRSRDQEPLEVQIEMTCLRLEEEQLPAFRGVGMETKAVIYCDKIKKGIVLNQQMIGILKQLTGDRTEAVPGVRIGLYLTTSNRSGSGYALQIRPGIPLPSSAGGPSATAESIPRPGRSAESIERDRLAAEEVERRRREAENLNRSTGQVPDDEIPF